MKKFLKNQNANVVVETAILLPITFIIAFGTMELGRYFWIEHSLENSVEIAGRYTMLNRTADDSTITTTAQNNLGGVPSNKVTYAISSSTIGEVNYKTISASYQFLAASNYSSYLNNLTIHRQVTVPLVP